MDNSQKSSILVAFLHQLSGQEKEPDVILLDHSYAKPWNAHPDSNRAKPARMLFMKGLSRHPQLITNSDPDAEIDVNTVPCAVTPPYDNSKARSSMKECERFVHSNYTSSNSEERESHLKRAGWSVQQNRLFNKVHKVLQTDRLSRLACEGTVSEPIKRRITVDKTARRMRQIFAYFSWDMKLLHWLHAILIDTLHSSLLAIYFDALQTLKSKAPALVDKILSHPVHASRSGFGCCSSAEALNQLIKRQWDPVLPTLNQYKSKKLPGAPLIVLTPSGPNHLTVSQSRRMKFWHGHLSSLGKVVNVSFHAANGGIGVSVDQCLEHIIGAVRTKVVELKNHYPNRPIILLGWTIGALIACHVALAESVAAVVCLGFPLTGINGSRGDLDDPLLDSRVPTLFVIGQNSYMCTMDDMEDFRERMKAETGLVVVGGADDMLRVSRMKKKLDNITQVIVDRCLVDEVGDFLAGVLTQPSSPSSSHSPGRKVYRDNSSHMGEDVKRRKRKPKEMSPDFVPAKRKPRQNAGRPALTSMTSKASSSSSSSETSSTGSCASEKMVMEAPKRVPGRKIGRPPGSAMKKHQVIKNAASGSKVSFSLMAKKQEQNKSNSANTPSVDVTKIPHSSNQAVSVSIGSLSGRGKFNQAKVFSVVNQRKNDPVDVEKAFGRDSSFLPRPLTPSLPESNSGVNSKPAEHGTSSAENQSDTVHDFSEKNATSPGSVVSNTLVSQSSYSQKYITVPATSLAGILGTVSSPKISYIKTNTTAFSNTSVISGDTKGLSQQKVQIIKTSECVTEPDKEQVEAIQKLQYHDFPLTTASLSSIATSGTPVITQAKILTSAGLNLKRLQIQSSVGRKSLLSSPSKMQTSVSGTSSIKPQTLLLSAQSSLEPTTFLISSPGKSLPSKSFQVQSMILKGSSRVPAKIQVPLLPKHSSFAKSGTNKDSADQPVDQQSCNLSLLSDVAGMKEPIREMLKRTETTGSSHATLVKLAPSERGHVVSVSKSEPEGMQEIESLKAFQICETIGGQIKVSSPPRHLETPEELAEKQMAIQALNSSLGVGTDSSTQSPYSREPGYSICYTNPDGSVVSRTVMGKNYSVVLPTAGGRGSRGYRSVSQSRSSGRGRGAYSLTATKIRGRHPKFQ